MGGASKVSLSLISEKYIDHFVLVVNPVLGINEATKLYLSIAKNTNISIITVITGVDLISPEALEVFVVEFKAVLKKIKFKKIPFLVNSMKDITLFSRNMEEAIHPIFIISAKTGVGLNFLSMFLSLLPTSNSTKLSSKFYFNYFSKPNLSELPK